MFANSRTIVRLFGLDIRIDPSWLLIAALITWSLWRHVFAQSMPDHEPGTHLFMAITAMLAFFGSLVLHEMAHALTGRRLGVETRAITLFLFGGVAELEKEPERARDELWIALAGPLMSFALAAGFRVLSALAEFASASEPAVEVLRYLALVNLVLALFNLVPAFPLDGGRILRAWLWQRSNDIVKATEVAGRVGTFLSVGLMTLGALSLFQGNFISGLWQMLLGLFILTAAQGSIEAQKIRTLLGPRTVGDLMTRRPIVTAPDITLAELVNQVMLRNRISFVPVLEHGVLLGHINSSVIASIDREHWGNTRVGDVFVALGDSPVIASDTPISDLFGRISASGQRKYLVLEGATLVGVITMADLTRYLGILQSLDHGTGTGLQRSAVP